MSWRDTLFVWRGDYTYRDDPVPGDRPSSSVYEGTWVGVSASDATRAAQPPDADFAKRTAPKFKVRRRDGGRRATPPPRRAAAPETRRNACRAAATRFASWR